MLPPANKLPATKMLDDDELALLVQQGDDGAFRCIMQRFSGHMYRIARGVVNDDAEAEDIVQEAFMRAYYKIATFRRDAPLRTWLISILLNEARSRLRKRHNMVGLEHLKQASLDPYWASQSHFGSAADSPTSLAAHGEIRVLLRDAISELPDAYRSVYMLREVQEFSVQETADRLAIKPQTVRTRLHRARRLLRSSLRATLDNLVGGAFPFLGARCLRMTTTVMAWLAAGDGCERDR